MRIIAFIEDEQFVKKILKSAAGGSNENHLRERMWYIRLWRNPPSEVIIIYDQSSLPSADDYLLDADHPTPRLSTGYPIETHL